MADTKKKRKTSNTAAQKSTKKSTSGARGRRAASTSSQKMRANAGRRTTAGRTAAKKTTARKTAAQKAAPKKKTASREAEQGISMAGEVGFIVSFGILVLMMLSNFGLCGVIGQLAASFFFGIFGCAQYVMPIAFFFGCAILIANDYSTLAMKKCAAGFILLEVISAFAQLLYHGKKVGLHELFSLSIKNRATGGVIGGGAALFLTDGFGRVGAAVILICVFLLALVLLTQRSFVRFFKNRITAIRRAYAAYSARAKKRKKEREAQKQKKKEEENQKEKEPRIDLGEEKPQAASGLKMKSGRKTASDKLREKQCEEKIKELASREAEEAAAPKRQEMYVPFVTEADEIKRKDQVRELRPTPYPLTAEDARREPFDGMLDFETFLSEKNSKNVAATEPAETLPSETPETGTTASESMPAGENPKADRGIWERRKAEGSDYLFPPFELLTKEKQEVSPDYDRYLQETAEKLQETLESFGVHVTITDISCGPTVTRYEMFPEQGTKVSKIVALSDDIKLNLAAADIRIEAPIPGKAAIGIEVPNKHNMTVHFRELVESRIFRRFQSKLAFAVGKDIGGKTVVTDLAKMPHLLIAGATGSGKSVCINTLIMSILYKAAPEEVRLIMIDPKMVELSVYNGIPHLLIPVVTNPQKASGALNWAVSEMTQRYKKFTETGVRNIEGYNEKVEKLVAGGKADGEKLKKMYQIVIVIDELADLMMVAPGEVEDAIVRLSQLARAAGIHLVIATQRPSVNVITGLIKANVPSRIAFSVSSGVDSRTIIDMNGAEKLLGKGDMLFFPAGYQKPVRVQGAFISDQEITAVVDFLKENEEIAVYDAEMEQKITHTITNAANAKDRDEYFEAAARFLVEKDKASIGMLQRMFKIGFNRAARIVDQLAEAGIVGPEEGTKPRKILMTPEQLEAYFGEMSK